MTLRIGFGSHAPVVQRTLFGNNQHKIIKVSSATKTTDLTLYFSKLKRGELDSVTLSIGSYNEQRLFYGDKQEKLRSLAKWFHQYANEISFKLKEETLYDEEETEQLAGIKFTVDQN